MNESGDIVYLDYAATTPVDPRVAAYMARFLTADGVFANPSAIHVAGRQASDIIELAASRLASLLHCDVRQLIWTSGATESNNLAILGAVRARAHRGKHFITMPTEHKAVTDVFRHLESQGFDGTWLPPTESGRLNPDALRDAIREDTQLASVMYVNNETGVLQDLETLGTICRENDVLFHVDAAQGVGKLPFDLSALPVDLASITAHKLHGPKGIGALYIAGQTGGHIEPITYGGGQQRRLRPGTLPVHLIAGFGLAAEIAAETMHDDLTHTTRLRAQLWSGIADIDGILLNGDPDVHYPGILNVSIDDIEGESLLLALEPLCVATGSACNSRNQEPSYVLRAVGRSDELAQSAIRFSFGRMTTPDDIEFAIGKYTSAVARLRSIVPPRAA
ncbi:MAG: cysteine desulfurase family protein [Woeseiaceae bacterium]